MKTIVVTQQKKEINQSVPQWMISNKGEIVQTNGKHCGVMFEGYNINTTKYSECWNKEAFTPIEGTITIEISNEE